MKCGEGVGGLTWTSVEERPRLLAEGGRVLQMKVLCVCGRKVEMTMAVVGSYCFMFVSLRPTRGSHSSGLATFSKCGRSRELASVFSLRRNYITITSCLAALTRSLGHSEGGNNGPRRLASRVTLLCIRF